MCTSDNSEKHEPVQNDLNMDSENSVSKKIEETENRIDVTKDVKEVLE